MGTFKKYIVSGLLTAVFALGASIITSLVVAADGPGVFRLASIGQLSGNSVASGTMPIVTDNGRHVVFKAGYLQGGLTGFVVRDTVNNTSEHASFSHDGQAQTIGNTGGATISNDGRYVVFSSENGNFTPNDTNNITDVFVRDLTADTTTRVSVGTGGVQANGRSAYSPSSIATPTISGNGRYVVFSSVATNLVPNDTNGSVDVFRHDRQTGETIRISVNSNGEQTYCSGNFCNDPRSMEAIGGISDDGRYVVFQSFGVNLSPLYRNVIGAPGNVYVRDTVNNTTTMANVNYQGQQNIQGATPYDISDDGRYVLFSCGPAAQACDLTADGDTGGQLYVRDMVAGTTIKVSVNDAGTNSNGASYSGARFINNAQAVMFSSIGTNLVPNDTNGRSDIFIRDIVSSTTTRMDIPDSVTNIDINTSFSNDGRYVALSSNNTLADDTDNQTDVFLFDKFPIPDAPTNLTIPSPTQYPVLNWTGVAGADSYNIYRDNVLITSTSNTNYTDSAAPTGSRSYYIKAVDNGVESAASNTVTVGIDRTPPTINYQLSASANDVGWYNSNLTITFTCLDAGAGGIVVSCTSPVTLTQGTNQVVTGTAVDNVGNTTTVTLPAVNIDTTPPAFGTPIWSANPINPGESATLTLPISDNLSGAVARHNYPGYYIDQPVGAITPMPLANGNATATFNNLSPGIHTIYYRAIDAADNLTTIQSTTITVRLPAPTGLSGNTATQTNPVLTWNSVTNASSYKVYRNGTLLGSVNGTTYTDTNAPEGTHNYHVVAVGLSTESNPSSSVQVIVDRTQPTITYSATPAANSYGWHNSNITITYTCNDALSGVQTCPAPKVISTEGTNLTAYAEVVDNAGNTAYVVTSPFKLDKTLPTFGAVNWTKNPATTAETTRVTIYAYDSLATLVRGEYFIGSDPGLGNATTLDSDNGAFFIDFSNLSVGTHTISYRALDGASNWSALQTTTLTVIPTAPTNLGATTPTHTNPILNWTAVNGADSYTIYRNGSAIATTTSVTYTDTAAQEGTHSYYVTATTSGFESHPSTSVNVVIDRTSPTVVYAQAPAPNSRGWYNTNVTVSFTCSDAQTGVASCTSPITLSNEGAGQTATGSATDNAGNTSSVTTGTINIDKTAPTTGTPTMTGGLGTLYLFTTNTTISMSVADTLSGVVAAEYYFDTDPGAGQGHVMTVAGGNATAAGNLQGLTGQHTLYVRVMDAAGNWSILKSLTFTRIGF